MEEPESQSVQGSEAQNLQVGDTTQGCSEVIALFTFDPQGTKKNSTPPGGGLTRKRGGGAGSEAETDGRSIGRLKTDSHLEESRPHPDTRRYGQPLRLRNP